MFVATIDGGRIVAFEAVAVAVVFEVVGRSDENADNTSRLMARTAKVDARLFIRDSAIDPLVLVKLQVP
jgi:hypothetical protein